MIISDTNGSRGYALDPRRSHTIRRGNWTIRADHKTQQVDVKHGRASVPFADAWVRQTVGEEPMPEAIVLWLDLHFEEVDYWLLHCKPH